MQTCLSDHSSLVRKIFVVVAVFVVAKPVVVVFAGATIVVVAIVAAFENVYRQERTVVGGSVLMALSSNQKYNKKF